MRVNTVASQEAQKPYQVPRPTLTLSTEAPTRVEVREEQQEQQEQQVVVSRKQRHPKRTTKRRVAALATLGLCGALTCRVLTANATPNYPLWKTTVEAPLRSDTPVGAQYIEAARQLSTGEASQLSYNIKPKDLASMVANNAPALSLIHQGVAQGNLGELRVRRAAPLLSLLVAEHQVRLAQGDRAGARSSARDLLILGQALLVSAHDWASLKSAQASVGSALDALGKSSLTTAEWQSLAPHLDTLAKTSPRWETVVKNTKNQAMQFLRRSLSGELLPATTVSWETVGDSSQLMSRTQQLAYQWTVLSKTKQGIVDEFVTYLDAAGERALLPPDEAARVAIPERPTIVGAREFTYPTEELTQVHLDQAALTQKALSLGKDLEK